jgi:predicted RNase H-like nuclease (RuvC/YqgF family)
MDKVNFYGRIYQNYDIIIFLSDMKMNKENIITISVILASIFALTGCGSSSRKQTSDTELETYRQEIEAQRLASAQDMNNVRQENANLIARVEELNKQIKVLQTELDTYKQKTSKTGNSEDWEQKYKKMEKDNEDLRELVQYERQLREDLMKRVEKDQATINELKNKLQE